MTQKAKRYTSVSKGGEFEIVGTSSGAGQRKGDVVIVYRNVDTGQIQHREPEDFAMRMKPITKPEINAQLLAVLLQSREWVAGEASGVETQAAQLAILDHAIAAAKGAV